MKTICLNRDSVCMGDDVEDHRTSIEISDSMTFEELFHILIENRYLPAIDGNDVVWVLSDEYSDLFSYVTKLDKMYSSFINYTPTAVNRDQITFKYFSSQLKRAEYIFKRFQGIKYHIWHEGNMDEYDSYSITEAQEKMWLSELNE